MRRLAALLALAAGLVAVVTPVASYAAGPLPSATTGAATYTDTDLCEPDDTLNITLNGTVNPSGQDTSWYFQYGPDTSYGSQTPTMDAGSGSTDVAVSATLDNTPPGQFHFRLVAVSAGGPAYGIDQTLPLRVTACPALLEPTLSPAAALAGCFPTTQIGLSATITPAPVGATVNGSAWFAYGPTAAYGQTTAPTTVPWSSSTAKPQRVTATVMPAMTFPLHYALFVSGPHGATAQTPDSTTVVRPPCPAPPISHTAQVDVKWSLVRIAHDHRTVIIGYQPPCGATPRAARISVLRMGNRARITVHMSVLLPAASCVTLPPRRTVTVHLPRGISALHLRH
jgi:hypothetical protein